MACWWSWTGPGPIGARVSEPSLFLLTRAAQVLSCEARFLPRDDPYPGEAMNALILVGGFGTRLRPLTLSIPKPLVPFCNRAMIMHQIEALVHAGVTKIVLAIAYKPEMMAEKLNKELAAAPFKVEVVYSHEKTPLGTAGPLALAREHLLHGGKPFFVLNADVTCKYPFDEMLKFHLAHGKEGTIAVTKVEEPSRYGVVVYDAKGKIERFVEKPATFVGNRINAGMYVFNPSILDRIEVRPTSIERDTFPAMAAAGELFAMDLQGFWMDVGQPNDYLVGMQMLLDSLKKDASAQLYVKRDGDDFTVIHPVLIHPTAKIGHGSVIGPNVTIGSGCVIGEGNRIQQAALLEGVEVANSCWINKTILGWHSRVGSWCRIQNGTVFGEDVQVSDGLYINGAKVS